MKWYLTALFVYGSLSLARPTNDWSKPCFEGECAYDIPDSTGQSGALRLAGPAAAITDITPAAGWVVLDCDAHALEQEIRLVCSGGDHDAAGCAHLFDHGGPLNRVVRLPESCSAAPFLRIADAKVAEDQSIPHHSASKVSRRDGAAPVVHVLRVDANWAAVDVSQIGTVTFEFTGTNAPGVDVSPSVHVNAPNGNQLAARGFWDWAKKAWNTVKTAVVNATKAVVSALQDVTSFKINPELVKGVYLKTDGDVTVYEIEKSKKPNCGDSPNGVTANLQVTAGGQVGATVKVGLTANGSVIPPSLGSFAVYAIFDADVDAHLQVKASILGHVETDRKRLGHFDVTPLQIPGVIALGPSVDLHASAELDALLEVVIDTNLKYKIEQMEFWYPKKLSEDAPQATSGSKSIESKPAPLSISAAVNVAAEVNVTAHLIPSLQLGLSVGGGAASLSAYIEADIWAKAHLRGEVSASVSHGRRELDASESERRVAYVPPYLNARAIDNNDAASASFKGCFGLFAGVVIQGGGQGSIGNFRAEAQPWTIYTSPELEIYHNCWGKTVGKRSQSAYVGTSLEKRKKEGSLKCGKNTPSKVGDGTTQAKKLH